MLRSEIIITRASLYHEVVYKRIQEKNPAVKLQASNAQIHAYNTDVPLELVT